MTVGTWTDTNFETQSGTEYKTALDGAIAVSERIARAFAPHEHPSFGMQVVIDAGQVFDGITLTEVAAQTISAIPAPTTNPRIDRIVTDQLTGVATRVAGTESASPSAPAIPSSKNPCCRVLLVVSQTNITNQDLTDERLGGGGVSALKEATFAVSIDTGETFNSGIDCRLITNTINQIVYRISVRGYSPAGGGKEGDPASQTSLSVNYTVNHNLGIKQLPSPLFTMSSSSSAGFIVGSLTIFYK